MQQKAIDRLVELREKGENKALIISATGSGKTYLSAFDVNNFKAKKMLFFLVHRENILISAKESFEKYRDKFSFGFFIREIKKKEKTIYFQLYKL